MHSWLADNANLLSAVAALVTLLSILAPLLLRRRASTENSATVSLAPLPTAPAITEPVAAQIMPLSATAAGPGAIAVMPFDSLTGDPADAALADGISCEITSALGRAGYLRIAPRADCFALRDKTLPLAEIARQLSVRYVVHGTVRHDADKLRVIAEFADTKSGRQLWSKTYERPFTDVLKVQEEIAQAIAASLGGEAFRAEVMHLAPGTGDTTAWSLAQKARHDYMLATTPAAIAAAAELARQAAQSDPQYAFAHALLAQLLMDLVSIASAADHDAACSEARASIEHALALSGRDPEILIFAGRVWVELGEREQSVAALRRGTQLAPYDLMAWGWLARALAFGTQDEAREALTIAERILEIAPEHPCVWTWEMFHGVACMNLGRYPEALVMFRKVVEAAPKFVRGLMALANALGALDQPEEAAKLVARVESINANFTPRRFAEYTRAMSASDETTARLTAGLRRAGLLVD